jgi:hypothetical protein
MTATQLQGKISKIVDNYESREKGEFQRRWERQKEEYNKAMAFRAEVRAEEVRRSTAAHAGQNEPRQRRELNERVVATKPVVWAASARGPQGENDAEIGGCTGATT